MANVKCRSCGEENVYRCLDLGKQAIVKFKDSPEEKDDYAWLSLFECHKCHLVQLDNTVAPERLYSQFHYLSGINQSMNDALFDIVRSVENTVQLKPGDVVVDIGANDGTLLSYYRRYVYTRGFEPAKNIPIPDRVADVWIQNYFSKKNYIDSLKIGDSIKAKVVTAIAMFYDLEDPNTFLHDVHQILVEDGVFCLQMNDLDNMTQNISVDNICHEHLCYYNIDTLIPLLRKNNLHPISVSYNGVNGGSIRVICSKQEKYPYKVFMSYKHSPTSNPDTHSIVAMWRSFEKEKKKLLRYIDKQLIEHEPAKIWAYGASTRGNTLLQLLGLDHRKIEVIADRNPKKWGKYTAGGNIPIVSEEEFRLVQPSNLLVLPYYFEEEFLQREIEYLKRGGKMIFPLPRMRIWTADKKGNLKVHGLRS